MSHGTGREMMSKIELKRRLCPLDSGRLAAYSQGGSQKTDRSIQKLRKKAAAMRAGSANRAVSLAAVMMVVTSVVQHGVQAGVVSDFNHAERCKDSLYMGTPPRGYLSNGFKKICQRYEDKPRYVTVYDPRRHIPIYSAYTFKKSDGEKKVDFPWMFEPQLASEKSSSNMEPFPQSTSMHMNFEDTQAVLEDYADVVQYDRGQLNPDEHQADPLDKASTYSLTNVVPQTREFNLGPWAEHQDIIRKRLNNYCRAKAYVVTGVTTSGHTIRRNNMDRVAVPEYMWSAYCCTEFDQNAPYFVRYKFPVFGSYGLNDRVNNQMVEIPLKNLEKFLKGRMDVDKNFQIFYNDCVPDN